MSEPDLATPPAETRSLEFAVPEMDCPSCAGKVTNSVETLEGIERLEARVTSGTLVVEYDPDATSEAAVRERVEAAGYAVESGTSELTLSVPEMDCPSCAGNVATALEGVAGVDGVETQPAAGRVTITGADVEPAAVVTAIESAGYGATPIDEAGARFRDPGEVWRSRRALGTAVGGVLVAVGMALAFVFTGSNPALFDLAGRTFALSHVLFVVAAAVAGTPIVRNGYYSARNRSLDIDLLMSIGILASVAAHHPFEGAMLAVL